MSEVINRVVKTFSGGSSEKATQSFTPLRVQGSDPGKYNIIAFFPETIFPQTAEGFFFLSGNDRLHDSNSPYGKYNKLTNWCLNS